MQHLLTILLLVFTLTVSAQTKSSQQSPPLTEARPASVGMSAERLARIDAMAKDAIEDDKVPGLVALVARRGKIVYHKAFGTADPSGNKLQKDAIFRIASQTKAVTATAVMMLWEEGLFRLDDPISKYIPEFKNPQVLDRFRYADTTYTTKPADKEITIRHLLTHTSGLGYGFIDGDERFKMIYQKAGIIDAFTTDDITIEENIKKLAKLPLHFNPGEKYSYAEGLDVLGYFVEIMSGHPFDEFLREHLFEPLSMNDTWFYLPSNKANRLVAVQQRNGAQWEKYSGNGYDADFPVKGAKTFFAGGAGLSSTAKDYATFLQMYLNGGELNGIRILSRTTVKSIMGNQIGDFWKGDGRYYGLAFGVLNQKGQDQGGQGSAGTFDWGGYFNTQYFADPQEELIGILMKQTRGNNGDDTGWKFRILANQAVDD
ncbi:MAG: serine hydrolase domain-containing protein [Bacteroidota bacterium]